MWHPAKATMCLAGLLAMGAAAGRIELRLPPDLVYDHAVGAEGAVVFRHSTHAGFADMKCAACHPAPFKLLHPTRQTSHELMDKGQSCGMCHDGSHAFATAKDDMCARCHTAWGKAQGDYPPERTISHSADSPGAVLFRHSSHRGPGISCSECHLPVYRSGGSGAQASSSPGPHGTCATCHDGTRAFALEDDAGCPRCHAMQEGTR